MKLLFSCSCRSELDSVTVLEIQVMELLWVWAHTGGFFFCALYFLWFSTINWLTSFFFSCYFFSKRICLRGTATSLAGNLGLLHSVNEYTDYFLTNPFLRYYLLTLWGTLKQVVWILRHSEVGRDLTGIISLSAPDVWISGGTFLTRERGVFAACLPNHLLDVTKTSVVKCFCGNQNVKKIKRESCFASACVWTGTRGSVGAPMALVYREGWWVASSGTGALTHSVQRGALLPQEIRTVWTKGEIDKL